MEATSYTQMNVRMPVELKRSGDAALESIGFIPTEAVRALWRAASLRGKALEAIRAALIPEAAATDDGADHADSLARLRQGRELVECGAVELGINRATLAACSADDAAALEYAREELASVKGWL